MKPGITHLIYLLLITAIGLPYACMEPGSRNHTIADENTGDSDRIPPPPLREEYISPAQNYLFVLLADDDRWQSVRSSGELYRIDGENHVLLWKRNLPHRFRPRFALVGNHGDVLLLDEWVNTTAKYAIMVISSENQLLVEKSFDDIEAMTGIARARIGKMSRFGTWLSEVPFLDPSGETAILAVGEKRITVSLEDGHIEVSR